MQELLLDRIPLFAEVPPNQVAELARLMQRRTYRRGEIIFHKGDPGTSLYCIARGQVKIVLPSETGEEAVIAVLETGDLFGELALFDGLPRSATMETLAETEVLLLRREDFLALVHRHPEMAIALLGVLSRRLRATDERIEDAMFLDVPGRLAKRLLELADRYGRRTERGLEITLRLSQQDLAAMVGATRESVNKHLGWMREHRLIELDRQRVILLRPDELRNRIY
jgi:CRP/FNR family transcriptional regulator, cyclic AMP receptor protein